MCAQNPIPMCTSTEQAPTLRRRKQTCERTSPEQERAKYEKLRSINETGKRMKRTKSTQQMEHEIHFW